MKDLVTLSSRFLVSSQHFIFGFQFLMETKRFGYLIPLRLSVVVIDDGMISRHRRTTSCNAARETIFDQVAFGVANLNSRFDVAVLTFVQSKNRRFYNHCVQFWLLTLIQKRWMYSRTQKSNIKNLLVWNWIHFFKPF